MERAFVDTSAWFAYADRRDRDHKIVRGALRDHEGRLVTSSYVFDEVVTLCRYRLGHEAALVVGQVLFDADVVDLVRVTVDDELAAWELFAAREDKEYSFTDCISFVLMRRLGIEVAVAVDDDFTQERFEVIPR